MFNKFSFLVVCVCTLFSSNIYANEDNDMLPIKEFLSDSGVCSAAVKEASSEYGVDFDLLQTISAVESGRWSDLQNRYVAWPWTVNAEGVGHYYASREEAVKAVKSFQAQGITSIDVGCMQISLKYHAKAFSSIDDAMDPLKNTKYSAKLLKNLYVKNKFNWEIAAQKYHSGNSEKGKAYSKRLEERFDTYKVAGYSQKQQLF